MSEIQMVSATLFCLSESLIFLPLLILRAFKQKEYVIKFILQREFTQEDWYSLCNTENAQKNFIIQHTQTPGPYFFSNHCPQVLLRIKEIAFQRSASTLSRAAVDLLSTWHGCPPGRIHELYSLLDGFTGGKLRALFQELRTSLVPPLKVSQLFAFQSRVNQKHQGMEHICGNSAFM